MWEMCERHHDGSGRTGGGSSSSSRHNGARGSEVGAEAAYHGALTLARSCEDVVAESAAGSGAPAAGRAAHGRNRSWPRAVGGRSSCVNLRPTGGGFRAATRRESEWARGVVTADGGNAPPGHGPAVSPPSLAPSHNYPFPPPHQHNPHHPCCESLLVAFTVRVL